MPMSVIVPVLYYDDVELSAAFLTAAFGFRTRLRIGVHRAQLEYAGASSVILRQETPSSHERGEVMVRVGNADRNHETARANGAHIVPLRLISPTGNDNIPPKISPGTSGCSGSQSQMLILPNGVANSSRGWFLKHWSASGVPNAVPGPRFDTQHSGIELFDSPDAILLVAEIGIKVSEQPAHRRREVIGRVGDHPG
jgi:hypothetical protein